MRPCQHCGQFTCLCFHDPMKFWMVMGNGLPTVKHATFESAHNEAMRLASMNKGQRFFVLAAVEYVVHSPDPVAIVKL